ncbi:uncharacterized protein [Drosophila pseudoobscura]|uniref:PARP16 N-terminal domain-containing protein n=1 Tax=Drosophila pseudoobscura pseudoobscura TaxID=46245 RepID=A0A6I8UFR0_DROPS|nr:uncharacterized protein LOC4815205 [Drosophila pseudoobscura]
MELFEDDVPSCSRVKSLEDLQTSPDALNVALGYGNGLPKSESPRPKNINELRMLVNDIRFMLRSQLLAYDAKLLIFAAAASTECPEDTMVPAPPAFKNTSTDDDLYDATDDGCDMERLRKAVQDNWPSCTVMMDNLCAVDTLDEMSDDDVEAVHLLHWVLADPSSPMLRRMSGVHLRSLCKHLGVARPSQMPVQLMSICYEDEQVTLPDRKVRRSHAYLGLNFGKLYRFLATGHLDHSGPEDYTRLYAQPESALLQCLEPQPEQMKTCWLQSRFGVTQRALVICALPSELERPLKMSATNQFLEYIVHDPSRLRPCHLLFYDEATANKMMMSWPGHIIEMSPQQQRMNAAHRPMHRATTETGRKIKAWAQSFWTGLVAVKRYVWASC